MAERHEADSRRSKFSFEGAEKWIAIGGVILLAAGYILHRPIFEDKTEFLREEQKLIVALFEEASADKQLVEAVRKNDKKAFDLRSIKFASRKEIAGRVETGIQAAERIIKCQQSYFCMNSDYDHETEQLLRKFWYLYRPFVLKQRGVTLPINFGQFLEIDARRILDKDTKADIFRSRDTK